MTFEMALTELPEGWTFTHLIRLDTGDYQCNILSETEQAVVVATGHTPAYAVLAAAQKACDPTNYMSLYIPSDHASPDAPIIRTSIDIAKLFIRKPVEKPRRI